MRTAYPAPSPGNNPRQPVPLVVNAVAIMFWIERAMIAFLPWATAATTTTIPSATAWPADNHYRTKPWMLHADQPIQHYQRQAIELRDEIPASTLKQLAPPTPLTPGPYWCIRLTTRAWENRLYRLPPKKGYYVYITRTAVVPVTTHTHVRRKSIGNKRHGKEEKRKERK